jgi:hypothetical protein
MLSRIEYPIDLNDIVVVGLLSDRARTFTIRPQLHGEYTLFIWPRFFAESRWTVRHDLSFPTPGSPPARVVFDLDEQHLLRQLPDWEWALVRRSTAEGPIAVSEALFSPRAVARGEVHFQPEIDLHEVRTMVWSCHQPFITENGRALLDPHTKTIMPWYRTLLDEFQPHVIWGLGDTAYADGTEATNFADQVYNHEGWQLDVGKREWLRDAYRRMYRYHWSFEEMQEAMRRYPHILMWDDHEIHDGWGSEEEDWKDDNVAMFRIAREAAEEYVLNAGPRMRDSGDAHQAYIVGPQASFIFDTRSSRNYADPDGKRILSDSQLADFRLFNEIVAANRSVRFYFLGNTVPFVYIEDLIEAIGSRAPKVLTDPIAGVRDDLRDSWASPGNREALRQLLNAIRELLWRRPDLHIVNVSGDIHVSNAFEIWPPGFIRPIYQVTSSAITNRSHLPDLASEIMTLDEIVVLEELGLVRRLWAELADPNVLCITTKPDRATLTLRVLPVDGSKATDQQLVLS